MIATEQTFYLNALGIACSLGNSSESVYQELVQSGIGVHNVQQTLLLSGRSVLEKNYHLIFLKFRQHYNV